MRESSLKGLSTEEAVGTEWAYLQNNADLFSANSPNPCLCWGLTLLLVLVSKMWVTIRELKMEVLARVPSSCLAALPQQSRQFNLILCSFLSTGKVLSVVQGHILKPLLKASVVILFANSDGWF